VPVLTSEYTAGSLSGQGLTEWTALPLRSRISAPDGRLQPEARLQDGRKPQFRRGTAEFSNLACGLCSGLGARDAGSGEASLRTRCREAAWRSG
jgi:hypothetical protein